MACPTAATTTTRPKAGSRVHRGGQVKQGMSHESFRQQQQQQQQQQHPTRTQSILAPLASTGLDLHLFYSLPDLVVTDKTGTVTCLPAAYVRAKATQMLKTWMSRVDATHYLHVSSSSSSSTTTTTTEPSDAALYPVHEWVFASQCTLWHALRTPRREVECEGEREDESIDGRRVLHLAVPHLPSIDALFYYLHSHDEQALYDAIARHWTGGSARGEAWIRGLIANIACLGIINPHIKAVVWAVIEP